MTLSDQLRAAALGQTPQPYADLRADWVGMKAVSDVAQMLGNFWGLPDWSRGTETQRRMFLLLVAEAIES